MNFSRTPLKLLAVILTVIFCVSGICAAESSEPRLYAAEDRNNYQQQRMEMIRRQIRGRGIEDPEILAAFEKVPRHKFVPDSVRKYAYEDRPLPIGEDQTISQPYIVAFMTRAINPENSDSVLEIGTGSGYQAAILAELCDQVYTIEIIESLGKSAKNTLSELNYKNVHVKIGDGYKGWPEHAPFDAIVVTCAPTEVPEPLKEQLAEGGRIVIPVGRRYEQSLVLLEKKEGRLVEKQSLPVRFVPMVDKDGGTY